MHSLGIWLILLFGICLKLHVYQIEGTNFIIKGHLPLEQVFLSSILSFTSLPPPPYGQLLFHFRWKCWYSAHPHLHSNWETLKSPQVVRKIWSIGLRAIFSYYRWTILSSISLLPPPYWQLLFHLWRQGAWQRYLRWLCSPSRASSKSEIGQTESTSSLLIVENCM